MITLERHQVPEFESHVGPNLEFIYQNRKSKESTTATADSAFQRGWAEKKIGCESTREERADEVFSR